MLGGYPAGCRTKHRQKEYLNRYSLNMHQNKAWSPFPPTKILLVCNMIQAYMLIKGYRNVFILFYVKWSKALISALQSAHLVRGLLWLTRLVSSLDNRVYAENHIELTWNACSPTLLPASLRGRNAWWPPWNCCIELMVWPLGYGT